MNRQLLLFFAWLIALVATVFTLYMSIVKLVPVCNLCWYQRICLYPLVIILGIGAYYDDIKSTVYSLPLIGIGALLALYHSLLQWFPALESIGVCGVGGPLCSDSHAYPFISLAGFITLAVLTRWAKV